MVGHWDGRYLEAASRVTDRTRRGVKERLTAEPLLTNKLYQKARLLVNAHSQNATTADAWASH